MGARENPFERETEKAIAKKRLYSPDPLYCRPAFRAFAVFNIVFEDPVTEPFDQDLLTVRAVGIFSSSAGDVAFVNVFQP